MQDKLQDKLQDKPQKIKWTQKTNFNCRGRYLLLLISLILVVIDQITKWEVRHSLSLYEVKTVIPNYWNWTLAYNKGAAFSFLANQNSDWPRLFFGIIAVVISILLVNYILSKSYSKLTGVAVSFILGGAIGNLLDRIILGKVTDFIQWYFKTHYWPAFNFADSCICIGVTLLIIDGICFSKDRHC